MDVTQTATAEAHANIPSQLRHPGKGLADFYTPPEVAQLLTDWAQRSGTSWDIWQLPEVNAEIEALLSSLRNMDLDSEIEAA